MPDNGTIGAIVIACASAVTAVGGAVKGITDIKSTKDLVEIIAGEDGNGGLLGKLAARVDAAFARIEEVAESVDPRLRVDLDTLAEKVKAYRAELRARAAGAPVMATGSFPSVDTITSLGTRLDNIERRFDVLERRMKDAEDRSNRNESRLEKIDDFVSLARESLATIKAHLQWLVGKEGS